MYTVQPSVSHHPKYQDHGCLQEVVSYENRTIGGSIPRSGPDTFTFWQIIFLSYIHGVVPLCHLKFFIYSEWPSSHSEQSDHMMCQVVAYKRLKTMKNYKTIMPISGRSSAVARPNGQPRQAGVARGVRGHAPPPPPEKF